MKQELTTHSTRNEVDKAIWNTLKNSIFPGASDNSIIAVIDYCKAAKLDPLMKPVHIVKMGGRDVVMPGITAYRIQATRTGNYAGMTEPEFGPDKTEKLGSTTVTYPEWCKITVKKLLNGAVVEFTAKEYWKENYATAGRDSVAPNAMWLKRPYGQIAKVAESQALRKAFPDTMGGNYTYEEMEGKTFETFDAPEPKVVNDLADQYREEATEEVYNLDGKFISALEVFGVIQDKIDIISTSDEMEEFKEWREFNKASIDKFSKKHREIAYEVAALINNKRVEIEGK